MADSTGSDDERTLANAIEDIADLRNRQAPVSAEEWREACEQLDAVLDAMQELADRWSRRPRPDRPPAEIIDIEHKRPRLRSGDDDDR